VLTIILQTRAHLSDKLFTHTHTHPFNDHLSGTTRVSRYQKGKTNLDFTGARDSEWHWLGCMQVCTSLQTHNHASTPPLSFLQAGCPSCCPTNSVKALKAKIIHLKLILHYIYIQYINDDKIPSKVSLYKFFVGHNTNNRIWSIQSLHLGTHL